jgi:hypothetical protein
VGHRDSPLLLLPPLLLLLVLLCRRFAATEDTAKQGEQHRSERNACLMQRTQEECKKKE